MAVLFASGIVGSGKTKASKEAAKLGKQSGLNVYTVSTGDIFSEHAKTRGYEKLSLPYLDDDIQQALRTGVMPACAAELLANTPYHHAIVSGPLTLINNYGWPGRTFRREDFEKLQRYGVGLERRIVSIIIDDPLEIAKFNESRKSAYPNGVGPIISWSIFEAETARDLSRTYLQKEGLVVPRHCAPQFLLKVLEDPDAPIVYLAHPIDSFNSGKNRDEPEEKIEKFVSKMNSCAALITPIAHKEVRNISEEEREYTKFRDLKWFVRQSDMLIAYVPDPSDKLSTGITVEVRKAKELGKPIVLISPYSNSHSLWCVSKDVSYKFDSEDEFFDAVLSSRNNGKYRGLSIFLGPGSDNFRYHNLFPFLTR